MTISSKWLPVGMGVASALLWSPNDPVAITYAVDFQDAQYVYVTGKVPASADSTHTGYWCNDGPRDICTVKSSQQPDHLGRIAKKAISKFQCGRYREPPGGD